MATMNVTNTTSPSSFSGISICKDIGELKDPEKATPSSLAASFSVVAASTLTCPLTIFVNTLILLAFYTKPTLRTQSNVLLGAMTVNNLVYGVIGCPLFIAKEITYLMRRQQNCYLNFIMFNAASPVWAVLLTAINCERFLGLQFPIWHRVHVTKRRLTFVAVVSFVVALSITILRSVVEEARGLIMVFLVACTVLTFVFAVLIWLVIRRRNQEVQAQHQGQPNASAGPSVTFSRSETKAGKIATYLALSFFFTRLFPLLMVTSMITKQDWMSIAEPLTLGIASMDFLINPLIYGLMNQNIKKACLEIIKCN